MLSTDIKVITRDENSADQMAQFCNQFDKVCCELGAAVIYCHHHSKGYQGNKRSMDRASGSGVFARDPDALLDLVELDIKDEDDKRSAWRIEGTLREFPTFAPVNVWFDYPVHIYDDTGKLKTAKADGEAPWKGNFKKRKSPEETKKQREHSLDVAYNACGINGKVTVKDMAEYLGKSEDTVRRHIKEHGEFWVDGGEVGRKK